MSELAAQQCFQKRIYMITMTQWDERYLDFLKFMESYEDIEVYAVIPKSFDTEGYTDRLRGSKTCKNIIYRSCERVYDLDQAVTVFPVVPRDLVAKTALCFSDTFESSWILAAMENGGKIVFLSSGLKKLTGKEPKAYADQILTYYRKILEYDIRIINEKQVTDLWSEPKSDKIKSDDKVTTVVKEAETSVMGARMETDRKLVITTANIEQYADNGVLYIRQGDILTDLAKDKAKFLKLEIKREG